MKTATPWLIALAALFGCAILNTHKQRLTKALALTDTARADLIEQLDHSKEQLAKTEADLADTRKAHAAAVQELATRTQAMADAEQKAAAAQARAEALEAAAKAQAAIAAAKAQVSPAPSLPVSPSPSPAQAQARADLRAAQDKLQGWLAHRQTLVDALAKPPFKDGAIRTSDADRQKWIAQQTQAKAEAEQMIARLQREIAEIEARLK